MEVLYKDPADALHNNDDGTKWNPIHVSTRFDKSQESVEGPHGVNTGSGERMRE